MRIAITGSKGQLGTVLQRALGAHTLFGLDLPEHDLTRLPETIATLGEFGPEVVIHAAAMTDVDGCERNPEAAYRANVLATRNVAVAARKAGAAMVYISTDYVFDGEKPEPVWEYDAPNPLSVYGRTKWVGEQVVRDLLPEHYVVRIAWLYSAGPRNFCRTVLRLAAERDSLTMVTDEVGSPTYAPDLAAALSQLILLPAYGIYHLPNRGVCSRYDWTAEILRLAGLADKVKLTASSGYQRAAQVPKYVELRNFFGAELAAGYGGKGITMRPWQEALAACMTEIAAEANER